MHQALVWRRHNMQPPSDRQQHVPHQLHTNWCPNLPPINSLRHSSACFTQHSNNNNLSVVKSVRTTRLHLFTNSLSPTHPSFRLLLLAAAAPLLLLLLCC